MIIRWEMNVTCQLNEIIIFFSGHTFEIIVHNCGGLVDFW